MTEMNVSATVGMSAAVGEMSATEGEISATVGKSLQQWGKCLRQWRKCLQVLQVQRYTCTGARRHGHDVQFLKPLKRRRSRNSKIVITLAPTRRPR